MAKKKQTRPQAKKKNAAKSPTLSQIKKGVTGGKSMGTCGGCSH